MNILQRNITIAASAALSAALGTIHAFSVFIPEWEGLPGADRASVTFVYSLALVSLTLAVFFGYRLYRILPPFALFTVSGVLAALGLLLSSKSSSLLSLYLSYGVLFGSANGLGYGYLLQLSGQSAPSRRGFAMGLVTAFYAVGASTAPLMFVSLIERGGNSLALTVMAAIVLVISIIASVLIFWANAQYESEPASRGKGLSPVLKQARVLLWLGYGSAVAAGLMIIGHAYGIAVWLNFDSRQAGWATTTVAIGNMLGGFSAGYYADRLSSRAVLGWLPLFTTLGLMLLLWPLFSVPIAVFVGVAIVGYCYGAIIAVYPVAVSDFFGSVAAPRIYGQVFTAWGLAGLLGPWFGGWLFDQTGTYTAALGFAMVLSVLSVAAIRCCKAERQD